MTVKQHVAYELAMVVIVAGSMVSAVVGGTAALVGQADTAQTAWELSGALVLLFGVGCLAKWLESRGPYAVCVWCGKAVPEDLTTRGIDGRVRCSGPCPQPTRWAA